MRQTIRKEELERFSSLIIYFIDSRGLEFNNFTLASCTKEEREFLISMRDRIKERNRKRKR